MSGRYLLDTNVVIALFAGEPAVRENAGRAEEVFVSSVAIGELCFGARKSGRARENLARNVVLGCDTETAFHYGEIKNALRVKGHPLPENDIWMAAVALQHDLTLITRDAHFNEIEGLTTIAW